MPLDPKHAETIISFFTSAAWADLRALVEDKKPDWPIMTADALITAGASRRREGYEMCMANLLREAGVIAPLAVPAQDNNQPPANINPMQKAMDEMIKAGEYVNTAED